ncbi:alpha/beta fold hydrolase [Microtetraspora sp. AC03309]|uniref:alpha/beta fold hydrolase n=1 Tax=Microtetraspora sp. AC03309 TaxID=2779376 RepID=UPI001E63BCEC|nr:alpha/beta hydrolase [Microtetraspora sp. AC03309]MCC5575372.1 alpha/beta fold hydrolase [Microtetraspora sp. AC03309]
MITRRDVPVGEYVFHLLEAGNPAMDTVLWLHGSGPGANAETNWSRALADLSRDLHHIAPDMIGFADSTHPDPAPSSASAFAQLRTRTLLGLLDELGLERVHVVGNSMGGIIGLAMALAAPGRIGRLVLMGSGGAPVTPTPDLLKLITYYSKPTVDALADLMRAMIHDPSVLGTDLEKVAETRMERIQRPEVRRSHEATFAVDIPGLYSPEQLATLEHPALVIHGREDRIMPVEAGQYLAQHLPNAQLHTLPNTGHWTQIEQPERFAFLVRSFLAGKL